LIWQIDDDVNIRIQDAEVVCPDEDILMHLAEFACQLGTHGGSCHCIDWYRVPVIFLRGVKDLPILLPWLFKDVLWDDEAVGDKPPEPVGDMDDVVIPFLLVHGGHYLVNLQLNSGVISPSPVKECIFMCGACVEVIGASHRHHAKVMSNEGLGNAVIVK
jgi:hypothetical protein